MHQKILKKNIVFRKFMKNSFKIGFHIIKGIKRNVKIFSKKENRR